MKDKGGDIIRLRHIIDATNSISEYYSKNEKTKLYSDAIERNITIIGEAVRNMMTDYGLRMTRIIKIIAASSVICHLPSAAIAAPSHCLSLYGECKYKPGFTHFDYVNPDAPKGGAVKLAETAKALGNQKHRIAILFS